VTGDGIVDAAVERRQALLEKAEKRLGKDRAHTGDSPELFLGTVPTDIPQLDQILGGGWRRGRLAIVTGEASMGKTLITQWTIKAFQARGLVCGFMDPEKTFDAEWFGKTGVNVSELLVARPSNTEQAFDLACDWVKGGMDLVVIDSMAALVPKARAESGLEESEVMGRAPFKLGEGLKQLNNENLNSFILCTNQLRSKFGVMYGSPDVMPGGRAQRFVASYILSVRRSGWLNMKGVDAAKGEQRSGYKLRVETEKSKLTPPFQSCEIPFMFTGHIDVIGGLIDLAIDLDVLKVGKGGYYNWQGVKYHGFPRFREHLDNNPDDVEALKAMVGSVDSDLGAMDEDELNAALE
jgi:recombination protein RecA